MAVKQAQRAKKSEAHEDKRQMIVEECASLFDRIGYHKTSMQMLAEEVGLGKPTLYHYFPSKNAILFAIHEAHMSRLLSGLKSGLQSDPLDCLRSACEDILTQIAKHPGYVRAFMDHYADLEGEMRDTIRAQRLEYVTLLQTMLEEAMAAGKIKRCDPVMTTYGFLGMCNWAYKWYPPLARDLDPKEAARQLCEPLFGGLRKD